MATALFHRKLALGSWRSLRALPTSKRVPRRTVRAYSSTRTLLLSENAASDRDAETAQALKDYNLRLATYKKQVRQLRKEYAQEYAEETARDEAERAAVQAIERRKTLERQRRKNIRSAQNALKLKAQREQQEKERQETLRITQEKRDAKRELYNKARQNIIDELEAEAHLWLTTPEEVEAAFTPEAEQLLWTRPQGIIGAPNPSDDAAFWQYEAHTWDMSKTYTSRREDLLEIVRQNVYYDTNVDKAFWTDDRLKKHIAIEEKARLRALIRDEGKRRLLHRQAQFLLDAYYPTKGEVEVPKSGPIPSTRILADTRAMEKEGMEALREDPTRFFIFQSTKDDGDDSVHERALDDNLFSTYSGPTLGKALGIRDPLRTGKTDGEVYPRAIGKFGKIDDGKSSRQKKIEEREKRLVAAAQAQESEETEAKADFDADDDADFEPFDYDELSDEDEEDFEDLTPEEAALVRKLPPEYRYSDEDIEWVLEQLRAEMDAHRDEFKTIAEEIRNDIKSRETEPKDEDDEGQDLQYTLDVDALDKTNDGINLRDLGVDVDSMKSVVSTLTEDQFLEILALGLDLEKMTVEEMEKALRGVPGLSEEQVSAIIRVETELAGNTDLQKALHDDSPISTYR